MVDLYLSDDGCVDGAIGLEFIGALTLEELSYLEKFEYLAADTLQFFDDTWLSCSGVEAALHTLTERQKRDQANPGFRSTTVEKYKGMLNLARERRSGLACYCD